MFKQFILMMDNLNGPIGKSNLNNLATSSGVKL